MWHFILVFYGCNILGMLIGIEVSYLAVDLIFHIPFHFLSNFSNYGFSFLVFAVVGTVIYFYRLQQANMNAKLHEKELDLVKAKQLITQAELQTLQSKINPHFLYNSLNSIAGLIHEDADKAEDMTLKLSRLFRYSINSNQDNMALVTEEMEIVTTYLDIEKVRFGDRLGFVFDIGESVKNEHIPRFLIQPLVENALKHGLNDMASDGKLKISITRQRENMIIAIADNGKPFPAELNIGYGLQSTYDKLALLYDENYQVQIVNTPEKQVRILIPVTT
jgi:LytS/YehU family sensor histidine kinase